ncbi:MAG: DUF3300 domain-containing protein [Aestuariivirga sp.]|uniref:DUF3300 domain-containing protein n=1 Tax=Aestuariivirga sp. TaxID=2650926 RepID=UPI0038D119FD
MTMAFLRRFLLHPLLLSAALAASTTVSGLPAAAQTAAETAAAQTAQAPEPLTAEELEVLVARIALYPDELVAVISAASQFPLQIIEAQRFLGDLKSNKDLKPKTSWDGSVISLLNYPDIVSMMSEDLDWTQLMGEAIVNQQDDVLAAIQQLREQAVANGVIKSDGKVTVSTQAEEGHTNIIIEPASTEAIYVPRYDPQMLYDPGYAYEPIGYYPDPYPYYWSPAATFFAGAVTGAIWAAAVDWDDGFWGGPWNWGNGGGADIDFDCNKCIIGNDFSGKLNIKDVDWRNVDRSKINIDKTKLNKIDNAKFKDGFKDNNRVKISDKKPAKPNRPSTLPSRDGVATKDIRKSTLEGLNKKPVKDFKPSGATARPDGNLKPGSIKPGDKIAKPSLDRPVGQPKPGLSKDIRPNTPPPLGEITRGRDADMQSLRGNKSMGGGIKRPSGGGGGQKFVPKHKMGGGGGHRGRR